MSTAKAGAYTAHSAQPSLLSHLALLSGCSQKASGSRQARRVCSLVTILVCSRSDSDQPNNDVSTYPDIDFFVESVARLDIKQFRSTVGHCAMLCSNVLLEDGRVSK